VCFSLFSPFSKNYYFLDYVLLGKSSRIPVMLLNAQLDTNTKKTNHKTKLFISQPRRIAAKALLERLRATEPQLQDQMALRMGHGVREYEIPGKTRAWFVTTGYLVRLVANHPERMDDIDIIIIDEVHERSVDTGRYTHQFLLLYILYCINFLFTNVFLSFFSLYLTTTVIMDRYFMFVMSSTVDDQSTHSTRSHVRYPGGSSLSRVFWN
jgi:hypothetical protein